MSRTFDYYTEQAERDGYQAYIAGERREDNPFIGTEDPREEYWNTGYDRAEEIDA